MDFSNSSVIITSENIEELENQKNVLIENIHTLSLNLFTKSDFYNNIEILSFDDKFNSQMNFQLPKNLKSINFGKLFNRNFTPNKELKNVKFGENFNQIFIPNEDLETLEFGFCFNQKFTPNNKLKSIKFSYRFNKKFTPNDKLEEYICLSYYKQVFVPNDKLKSIKLGPNYDFPFTMNEELESLTLLCKNYNNSIVCNPKLKELYIHENLLFLVVKNDIVHIHFLK
jgi:hypothetical protein